MDKTRTRVIACSLAFAIQVLSSSPAAAQQSGSTNYWDPLQVKVLVEQTLQRPQNETPVAIFYAGGISHFDEFIPFMPDMTPSWDQAGPHWKFTYRDGRIAKAESTGVGGEVRESYELCQNASGAPVLERFRNRYGNYDWYMYAEYESTGKIHALYRFNGSFELSSFKLFSYPDNNVTVVKDYNNESRPTSETIYDNGAVFVVENREKRLVNHVNRQEEICRLTRFGLKPIYPSY